MTQTFPSIISTFDPTVEAALAQMDTPSDALALLDDSQTSKAVRAQIREDWLADPAQAMVNIALRRQAETGEEGTDIVKPLLLAMGYDGMVIDAHTPRAKQLYAKAVRASQKALQHGRAS